MEPERQCKSGMDGGLRAALLVSPLLHLRMDDFLSNRWGPPQEYILFLSAADARFITELALRKISREPRWDRQRALFEQFLQN
jgi:hypothetical protein